MTPLIVIEMNIDRLYRWLAWKFPKDLVKWVLIRAMIKTHARNSDETLDGKNFSITEVIEGWVKA